jgi:hypothetical protein
LIKTSFKEKINEKLPLSDHHFLERRWHSAPRLFVFDGRNVSAIEAKKIVLKRPSLSRRNVTRKATIVCLRMTQSFCEELRKSLS